MSPPSVTTPERIMDAAEALFAEHGYDAVSTRAITELAGVRLNLLSYHFGSKEKLFQAVIDRRLDVIVQRREQALEQLRGAGGPVTVGGVLRAFIHPYFELSHGDRSWLNYARLVALTSQSERDYQVLDQYMQRTVRAFMRALREALPDVSPKTIRAGFYYAITLMMSSFSGMNRIDGLVEGTKSVKSLERAARPLVTFAEAGILALAAADRERATNT
ncbi:TetR/AcrR family transcriptional regulator [Luteimonas sp. A277]